MALQKYKSISFNNVSVTLAFSEKEKRLFDVVNGLTSLELKEVLGGKSFDVLKKKADKERRSLNQYIKLELGKKLLSKKDIISARDVTFENSKDVPFQRWFPYIEGYSINFVKKVIDQYCNDADLIYEPFAGTGTTIFAADNEEKQVCYSEVNPLLRFLIDVKIKVLSLEGKMRRALSSKLIELSLNLPDMVESQDESTELASSYEKCFGKSEYFQNENKNAIMKMRSLIDKFAEEGDVLFADLLKIATCSILIPVSYLKRQGDIRFKTEKEKKRPIPDFYSLLKKKLNEIATDVVDESVVMKKAHFLLTENAKKIGRTKLKKKISAVITSPPYLNGTNYFRNTKVELWFLGFLKENSDLRSFRDEALTSGINDVICSNDDKSVLEKSSMLKKTFDRLQKVAYDRRIPLMALAYFAEMEVLFRDLAPKLKKGAKVVVDLGDSIFSGVHIKTDYILAEILKLYNYDLIQRVVLRKRRSKNGSVLSQIMLIFVFGGKDEL